MNAYFWFIAGTLTGVAVALVMTPLWRVAAASLANRAVRLSFAVVGVIVFAGSAIAIYRTFGSPELLDAPTASATTPHAGALPGQSADSMENAVAGLEARVARDGGNREDWQLLAQSYELMGRSADAERARRSAEARGDIPKDAMNDTAAAAPAASSESISEQKRKVSANPRDVDAWRALAGIYRRQHAYDLARDALAHLRELDAMTADTWADQADVLASIAGGSLRGEPARAIDRALALDDRHAKALWLKASLAHEEGRNADALAVWKKLRAALPPDSPDVRIVDANIVEASELAGGQITASAAAAPTAKTIAEVSGTVTVDRRLAGRIPPGATLYMYAKAVDSPGPPLAVLRQVTGAWPVSFRLDDSLAMIPTRKLSQFDKVIVEARVSRSGDPTPTTGDLYATSAVLKPGDGKQLKLIINREVG